MIRTAFALVTNAQDQVLLIQEGYEPAYGQWCLPGGHIGETEEIDMAAKREVEEETGGLIIAVEGPLMKKVIDNSEYQGRPEEDGLQIEVNIFKAFPLKGEINPANLTEELAVKWFTRDEAKALPLRWPWLKTLF